MFVSRKSIVLYFSLKGTIAVEIHADLVATLKADAGCSGLVTSYLRSRSFTASIDPEQRKPPDPVLSESDKAILAALEEQPFASVRKSARATHLTSSTVYCHLTEKSGYTVRYLR
jgi:hypothetical protein